jgi:hypothetical protein
VDFVAFFVAWHAAHRDAWLPAEQLVPLATEHGIIGRHPTPRRRSGAVNTVLWGLARGRGGADGWKLEWRRPDGLAASSSRLQWRVRPESGELDDRLPARLELPTDRLRRRFGADVDLGDLDDDPEEDDG